MCALFFVCALFAFGVDRLGVALPHACVEMAQSGGAGFARGWIPAFAGMTVGGGGVCGVGCPAARVRGNGAKWWRWVGAEVDSRLRGNDGGLGVLLFAFCFLAFALCPLPFALCPLPFALCPLPFALCPLPFALCPLAFGFWLLAFGFWLLAFGFWLLALSACLPCFFAGWVFVDAMLPCPQWRCVVAAWVWGAGVCYRLPGGDEVVFAVADEVAASHLFECFA